MAGRSPRSAPQALALLPNHLHTPLLSSSTHWPLHLTPIASPLPPFCWADPHATPTQWGGTGSSSDAGAGVPGQREGDKAGEQGGAEATRRGSGDAGGAGGFPTVSLIEIGSP